MNRFPVARRDGSFSGPDGYGGDCLRRPCVLGVFAPIIAFAFAFAFAVALSAIFLLAIALVFSGTPLVLTTVTPVIPTVLPSLLPAIASVLAGIVCYTHVDVVG
jgi:hypothetical protein